MVKQLGSLLIEKFHIDSDILTNALEESRALGMRLGECLITRFGISESAIFQTMAEQFDIPFMASAREKVSRSLFSALPIEIFNEGRCFPVSQTDDALTIIICDPLDFDIILDVERVSGKRVEVAMTTPSEMEQLWESFFRSNSFFKENAASLSEEYERQMQKGESAQALTRADILKRTEAEPVVKMVNLLFSTAFNEGASDIHIEPYETHAAVRYRINGMLLHHMEISSWMCLPVISRIKILADIDIAEKRIPQDGRIAVSEADARYDLRVSTLPTSFGEKTVIRILRQDRSLLDLEHIGLPDNELAMIKDLVARPQGIVFVTGPTGSGKSTLLFACLNQIRHKAINITTIENPIEYKFEGITQVQVNEKAGLTFAKALRSILRQDPDVILVGEIRDPETAEIAVQAAQTGHLVFATLHTNDAVAAITRLKDLGIPPFMLGSSLLAISGQRLVRALCPKCKIKTLFTENQQKIWATMFGENVAFPTYYYKAAGCNACGQSGFASRTGVFELAVVNEMIRNLISDDTSEAHLRKAFRENGMKTMVENGFNLVARGITSPEELFRIVSVDTVDLDKEAGVRSGLAPVQRPHAAHSI